MKKYTIKEFAEGKKAVKIENEEQWNKLNKVHGLCRYHGSSYYTNKESYTSGENYLKLNSWEVLEFSQLDFEDEFVVGSWYKYRGWYIKFARISGGVFQSSEEISDNGIYSNRKGNFGMITNGETRTLLTDLSEIQQYLPENHPDLKEKTMNTFGLKVGDHLPQEVISEWVKQGNNRYHNDSTWHSSTVPFVEPRTIEEFKTCDGFTGMLVSGTTEVYLKCEGFLEFKESFNKEKTMEKEIIGYKLVKPEYKEAVSKIIDNIEWFDKNFDSNLGTKGFNFKVSTSANSVTDLIKKAGVLDFWFEPVFTPDKPKLPTINGKQCVDNGDKTITCGCTTKSFDWILGVDYAMGEEIDISGTKVSDKEIRQIVEYINKK